MVDNRYSKNAGSVHSLSYHIVFCPKFRRGVLTGNVADALEARLREKAQEQGFEIHNLAIRPDHVHLFVSADPTDAPCRIVSQLKGYTARCLRRDFPPLRSRLPCLWSRSYYIGSTGHVSDETVRRYIEAQKGV